MKRFTHNLDLACEYIAGGMIVNRGWYKPSRVGAVCKNG